VSKVAATRGSSTRRRPPPSRYWPFWGCREIAGEMAGALRLYYPFEFEPGPDYIMWMEHLAHQVASPWRRPS